MAGSSRAGRNKRSLPVESPGSPRTGIDRREFISNGCKLAGALLVAGSLGALAGCGRETSSAADTGSNTQKTTPDGSTDSNAPGSPPGASGNVDCRFYNNGICSKTGKPCTNCMEGH